MGLLLCVLLITGITVLQLAACGCGPATAAVIGMLSYVLVCVDLAWSPVPVWWHPARGLFLYLLTLIIKRPCEKIPCLPFWSGAPSPEAPW